MPGLWGLPFNWLVAWGRSILKRILFFIEKVSVSSNLSNKLSNSGGVVFLVVRYWGCFFLGSMSGSASGEKRKPYQIGLIKWVNEIGSHLKVLSMFVPSKFNICYFQAFQVSNVIKEKYQHNSKQHHFVSKIYCNGLNKHAINIHGKSPPY